MALKEKPKHPRAMLGAAMASLLGRDWETAGKQLWEARDLVPQDQTRALAVRDRRPARHRADSVTPAVRIGIDLGGTKIEGLALADDGREIDRRRIAAPRGSYDHTDSRHRRSGDGDRMPPVGGEAARDRRRHSRRDLSGDRPRSRTPTRPG